MSPRTDELAPARNLILGTAQFGSAYGISNRVGQPGSHAIEGIIDVAVRAGVQSLDTAPTYGMAESALAASLVRHPELEVVTKVAPADTLGSAGASLRDAIVASAARSLASLGRCHVDTILVHHSTDLMGPAASEVAAALRRLKARGQARRVGFSAYSIEEVESAAEAIRPDVVQLPLSLFDQRLLATSAQEVLERLRRGGTEVHVRSIFLQGAALMDPAELPQHLAGLRPAVGCLGSACGNAGTTPLEACIAFARSCGFVDGVVVGVTTAAEMAAIGAAWNGPGVQLDWPAFSVPGLELIDPRKWPAR